MQSKAINFEDFYFWEINKIEVKPNSNPPDLRTIILESLYQRDSDIFLSFLFSH